MIWYDRGGPKTISIVLFFPRDGQSVGEGPAQPEHILAAIMYNSDSQSKKGHRNERIDKS